MSKAEQRALEAYPKATRDIGGIVIDIGHPQYMRDLYIEGYHQAEKDLELTWEDIKYLDELILYVYKKENLRDDELYKEVLKRFKERTGDKHRKEDKKK